jgi:hypothetical protein
LAAFLFLFFFVFVVFRPMCCFLSDGKPLRDAYSVAAPVQ